MIDIYSRVGDLECTEYFDKDNELKNVLKKVS